MVWACRGVSVRRRLEAPQLLVRGAFPEFRDGLGRIDTAQTCAGTGARTTPVRVLTDLSGMAAWLAGHGWHLHSGGAPGRRHGFH